MAAAAEQLSMPDDAWLDELSRRAFFYFWDQADPKTGLVLDRARNDGSQQKGRALDVASVAATGFALTALPIAGERGWIDHHEAQERVRVTLRFLVEQHPHHRGWFYHFVDRKSGARAYQCELSSIDTALLIAGALAAQGAYAADDEIVRLAQALYDRVDFWWMYNRATQRLRMGWTPETGYLRAEWMEYRENLILHALAMGSRARPLPDESWAMLKRDIVTFDQYRFVGAGPIFTHQFPQAWLPLQDLVDRTAPALDYFQNSITATYAHRAFCLSLRSLYPSFSSSLWGVTPSDSSIGYLSWGGEFSRRDFDGTVVPCAVAGSLMFTPEICLPALRSMQARFGERIYGRYGFVDSFHPQRGWANPDVLGIDQGITLLSAENLRSGRVWRWFASSPDMQRALSRMMMRPGV